MNQQKILLSMRCGCVFRMYKKNTHTYIKISVCDIKQSIEFDIDQCQKKSLLDFLKNKKRLFWEMTIGNDVLSIKKDLHMPQTLMWMAEKHNDLFVINISWEARHKIIELLGN